MELFRSSNGGDDWTLINPWWHYYDDIESKLHADIPEIRFYLDEEYNEFALISTDGGLYISDDYLSSVQNISLSGLGVSQYYSTYSQRFAPPSIFSGSQDQGFQKSIKLRKAKKTHKKSYKHPKKYRKHEISNFFGAGKV